MRDDYEKARKALAIGEADFALVAPQRHREITRQILERFTTLGCKGFAARAWWESFKGEAWTEHPDAPWRIVAHILRPAPRYWLVAESRTPAKAESQHWVYDAKGDAILRVLRETSHHEYYIIERSMMWLLCENHHGVLIACGDLAKPNLAPEAMPPPVRGSP